MENRIIEQAVTAWLPEVVFVSHSLDMEDNWQQCSPSPVLNHHVIVEAPAGGDSQRAGRVVRDHILRNRDYIELLWRTQQDSTSDIGGKRRSKQVRTPTGRRSKMDTS